MRARKYILFFLLFIFLFAFLNINVNAEEKDGFIWIISNNKLVKQSEHIVLDNEFFIFHTYNYISIRYYKDNETFFNRERQVGKMLSLILHDGATLEIKHNESILLKTITHENTLSNAIKYRLGVEFQQSIISIVMAFIVAILLNVAYYYNLERRII
ncbi:MAG TPA: hypothetical protein ENI33_02170 [Thermoplasmatales archaeon]|nr:hypothetical protein [Thermoplasmatales archaeon]